MVKEFKMSQERYDELKKELDYSKTTRADEIAELIKEARGFGDLSENSGSRHTVGLKSDGTVVACGYNKNGQCDVSGWKLFDNFDDVVNRAVAEEEKRKAAAEKRRLDRIAALEAEKQRIETELPHIKGLFSGGKRRDMENRLAEIEAELKRLEK